MGNGRCALRVYLWMDDGTQIHVTTEPNPDGMAHLVKSDLGDDTCEGMLPVPGTEGVYRDRAGKEWPFCQVDLWAWEWQLERRNMI